MKEKTRKLILTFPTTTDAIASEKLCKQQKIEGRLIPTPRIITASCGLAFCAPLEVKDQLLIHLKKSPIPYDTIGEYFL